MWYLLLHLFIYFSFICTTIVAPLPIVVLHGIDSSSEQLQPFCDWIMHKFNEKVFNIEIGNGGKTSLYSPLTDQVNELCKSIYGIEELKAGFDFIGMSQGGLIARGYVERCNLYPVRNLITLVTPHGGIYCKKPDISNYAYNTFFQQHLSIAGYWRNPTMIETYLGKCSYLPLINNEVEHNSSKKQAQHIRSLANFVMVWSPYDEILCPPESGKFSMLAENLDVLPLQETELYEKDLLGLKYLADNKRLHIVETNCTHVDHRNEICYGQLYSILKPFI
jgi:palmitoyl-protein thioesterase